MKFEISTSNPTAVGRCPSSIAGRETSESSTPSSCSSAPAAGPCPSTTAGGKKGKPNPQVLFPGARGGGRGVGERGGGRGGQGGRGFSGRGAFPPPPPAPPAPPPPGQGCPPTRRRAHRRW